MCETGGVKDGKYHKNLGLPRGSEGQFLGEVILDLSRHAREQCSLDDGQISLSDSVLIDVAPQDIIEIEVAQNQPVKAVVRLEYSETQDICFAITRPFRGRAVCKTVWLNSANDSHRTLNARNYSKPE